MFTGFGLDNYVAHTACSWWVVWANLARRQQGRGLDN